MHEVVICTSAEHDWGSHIGCNFDRMFVGEIWSGSAEAQHEEDEAIDYVFGLLDIPWWYYAIAVLIGAVGWKAWSIMHMNKVITRRGRDSKS